MTVASIGNYVAASYNNPYMSQSIGSDFGGSIFGVTEDGVAKSLQYRDMSDSQVRRNAVNAASNYLDELTIVKNDIASGNTSSAIKTFDAIVEQIMNSNSYYNITESKARSIAQQAFFNAFNVTLEDAINTSVDSVKERAAKEANDWSYWQSPLQADYTAEETLSLMLNGEEYDAIQKAKLEQEGKVDGECKERTTWAKIGVGAAVAGTLVKAGAFKAIAAVATKALAGCAWAGPVGWGIAIVGCIIAGCAIWNKLSQSSANKEATEQAKQARANA